jgi:phage terminase large subunit
MKRTLKVNYKIWEAMNKPQPIIVIIGGRGSGKSLGVGDCLVFEMDTRGYDVYCLREFQDSLSDSVHRVFEGSINDRLKLVGWEVQEKCVIAPNNARTTYKGANRNPDAMQSAQSYLRSWFEEAHRASQASLDKLLPTIIRNPGAKCIFTANPQSSGDPFSQRFIVPYLNEIDKHGVYEDELHYIVKVNWRDNPWWNEEQERLRAWDYENLSRAKYDWIWEGGFLDTVDDAIIESEWFDACVDAHIKLGFDALGQARVAYDPADTGDDKAVAYVHGSVVKNVICSDAGLIDTATDWATDWALSVRPDVFTWDADGMGMGLKRQISQAFEGKTIQVEAFRGSEGADDPDKIYDRVEQEVKDPKTNKETFINKRAQYYWILRDRMKRTYQAVEHGRLTSPDDLISFSSDIKDMQKLRTEICRLPRKYNGSGRIQLMTKIEMKSKLSIPSPNMADAVMMCMRPIDVKRVRKKLKSNYSGIV